MNKTILHAEHLALGAKMAPFGGFDMPIQYEGIIAEHKATRNAVTIFDTCHMGEFRFSGPQACADLEGIVSSPVGSMAVGQCRYGFLCNPEGGVIDDEIIYRMGDDEFFMVVNAGTRVNDFAWIRSHLSEGTSAEDVSESTAKLDIQGPESAKLVQDLLAESLAGLKFYRFTHNRYREESVLVSRTGYTGEIGFEIYCPLELAVELWREALEKGARPAGLGARDTLRLEMGFPLYGHELNEQRNAAESGFTRAIATDKTYIGSNAVLDQAKVTNSLVGLELEGRRAARQGDLIRDESGVDVGVVTSGSFSPSLGMSIALGYVPKTHAQVGTHVAVTTARGELTATVSSRPFYKDATGRRPLRDFL